MSVPRPPRGESRREGRDAPTYLALFLLLIAAGGLLALVVMAINPQFFCFVAFFLMLFGMGLFQYLVWGRRLLRNSRLVDKADEKAAE